MTYKFKNFKNSKDPNVMEKRYLMKNSLKFRCLDYLIPIWLCNKNIRTKSYEFGYNNVIQKLDLKTYLTKFNQLDCLQKLNMSSDQHQLFTYLFDYKCRDKLSLIESYQKINQKITKNEIDFLLLSYAIIKDNNRKY
jgi:hypothetical protein